MLYYRDHLINVIKKLLLIDGKHHILFTNHSEMPDFAINAVKKRNHVQFFLIDKVILSQQKLQIEQ